MGNANNRSGLTYVYGDDARLSAITNGATSVASYLQNGRGERVKKVVTTGGQTTYSLYSLAGELLVELDGAGNVANEYVYLAGQPVAVMSPELDPNGDADGDGMPNGWEEKYGLDPNNPADASLDPDHDGLTNLQEYLAGTDPNNPDTDGDGLLDGADPNPTLNSAAWWIPLQKLLQ